MRLRRAFEIDLLVRRDCESERALIATCTEHDVDPRTYSRDVLMRTAKVRDVAELTSYGSKKKWAPEVEAHRSRILE
jgi:hypothetical protein